MTEGLERMVVNIYSFHFRWNAKMQMMGRIQLHHHRPFVYVPTRYNTREPVHEPNQRCTGADRESTLISRRSQFSMLLLCGEGVRQEMTQKKPAREIV